MARYQAYYRGVTPDGNVAETKAPIRAPNKGLAIALAKHYLPPEFELLNLKENKLVRLVNMSTGEDVPLD